MPESKGGDVVMPLNEYTKRERVYRAFTGEKRREEDTEALALWKSGSRSKSVVKFGAAHGLGDLVVGAGVYALVTSDFLNKIEWIRKYWWARSAFVVIAGWILYRKGHFLGGPLMATGGALFIQAYREYSAQNPQKDGAKKETKGVDEAGWPWERERWEVVEPRLEGWDRRNWDREAERIAERVYPRAA
jgi:hypothetical protein